MKRSHVRLLVGLLAIGAGGWLVSLGNTYTYKGIPIWVIGAIIGAFAIFGLCGVNVFIGGPLDKNNDPK
jgi:4-hydroxybenzoate polyprenyltransferase